MSLTHTLSHREPTSICQLPVTPKSPRRRDAHRFGHGRDVPLHRSAGALTLFLSTLCRAPHLVRFGRSLSAVLSFRAVT